MDGWKAEMGRVREGEEKKKEDKRRESRAEESRPEKIRRGKMQAHQKVGNSGGAVFSLGFVDSGGSKNRLANAPGAEPSGQMRDEKLHAVVARSTCPSQNAQHHTFAPLLAAQMSKKCTPVWREARFQVNMLKAPRVRTTFGSCDVEEVHVVAVRSTCRKSKK